MLYGGFGLGAVGVVVGTVTGVLALSTAAKVTPKCRTDICPPSTASDLDTAKALAVTSNVAFALGALGVVAGLVGVELRPSKLPDVGVALWLAPQGLAAGGTF
jgi:hypothetical protein